LPGDLPVARNHAASSVRDRKPSLFSDCWMWYSTVRTDTCSLPAISRLVSPWLTSSATSRSRRLSCVIEVCAPARMDASSPCSTPADACPQDRLAVTLIASPVNVKWSPNALLLLAVQTGLRGSELTGLLCGDIHLGDGPHVSCGGKGRICRMQHMRPYVAARTMSRSGDGTPQPGGDRLCSLDICRVLFEALEEGEQRVGRPVAAGLGVRWCESIQGAPLEVHVGVDVLVGRLESLVAEPQGDRRHVHRCRGLEESHRRGVAEHMGSDALAR